MNLRYLNFVATCGLLFLFVYVLYIGKALLLPLVIALVFWYIIIRATAFYQKLRIKSWHPPYGMALIAAMITAFGLLYLFFLLLTHSITQIIREVPAYQAKLQEILDHVNRWIGGQLNMQELVAKINLTYIFSKLALVVSLTASNFVLILVYLLFLLLEHRTFNIKIKAMCEKSHHYQKISRLLDKIDHDVNSYLKIKTANNLLAGILSYIVLLIFGVNYPEFWGILIFLAHYVPYVGPMVAVVLILLASSIQVVHLIPFLILGSLLVIIQFAIGNFLEPKWMGNRLNLSPIVILITLAFWGAIWGILGMVLCIPLMVILTIVLAKFEKTKFIAVALSADGKINSSD